MSMQWRVRPGLLFRAGWSGVSAAIMILGVLLSGAGLVLALATTPVDAATVSCNATLATPLVPGDSGNCTFSYAETAAQAQNQPFTVTLGVNTVSKAGNGAAASGTATEALLDGQTTGLQVSVSDSSGNTFGIGTPSCAGAYPDATSCTSTDGSQVVPGASSVSSWVDTITVSWSLPLVAGNPYEGGSATVSVTAYYNGTPAPVSTPVPASSPGGAVLGISYSPSPSGGVLGASTPSTGAGPTSTASLVLIALGMVLLLIGASGVGWASRSRRRIP